MLNRRAPAAVLAVALVGAACTSGGRPAPEGASNGFPKANFTPPKIEAADDGPREWLDASCEDDPALIERVRRGWYPGRGPDVLWIPRFPDFFGGFIQTGHSGPWDYLQEVPLVFYGPGFIRPVGEVAPERETTLADVTPTLAELLDFQAPAGSGRSLDRILVPESKRGLPRLVLVIAWDGGGTNVLRTWPGFWPNLERMMRDGASIRGAIVGSSPSVTPATHTTLGTGTFPKSSGITAITLRDESRIVDSFKGKDADYVLDPMLADVYDPATDNAAEIGLFAYKGWHLGMLSHGANWPGGDADTAVFLNTKEEYETNPDVYSMPEYLDEIPGLKKAIREVDLEDGKLDGEWMGHDVLASRRFRRDTPVWVLQQTTVIKEILRRDGYGADDVPDLFYTNYKQIDEAGHNWNMLNPEVAEVVRYSDEALGDLERLLNRSVGEKRWVMVVTADHGQQPDAEATRGWPINMTELVDDLAAHFDLEPQGVVEGTAAGVWLEEGARANGITEEQIADFAVDYRIEDNMIEGRDYPEQYLDRLDEPVFSSSWPDDDFEAVLDCARSRSGS